MGNLFKKHTFVLLAAVSAGFFACSDEGPDNTPLDPLKVSRTSITVGNDAAQVSVSITALDGDWTLTGVTDWCQVDLVAGTRGLSVVTVDIAEYEIDGEDQAGEEVPPRETVLRITSGGTIRDIAVTQMPHRITTPDQHDDYFINEDIYMNVLSNWYFWKDEVLSTRADYNQSYDQFVQNYLLSLKQNVDIDGGTWSRTNTRYLYSYIERRSKSIAARPRLNYGMEFDLTTLISGSNQRMVGRVLYVQEGSPAATAGLKRGDWFSRVNGRTIEEWNYTQRIDTLVKPLYGETVTLGMAKRNYAGYLEETSTTVPISPDYFSGNPILYTKTIQQQDVDGNAIKVGYLVYSSFDPAYRQELIDVFDGFKAEGIDRFILDLRYNRSGSVEMAELMANLIAPQSAADNGRTFATYTFNDGSTKSVPFAPHESGIGMTKLVVIGTQFTGGASELLINAFNELEEVDFVFLGSRTEGMNVGMAALEDAVESSDYVYNIYPVAFSCANGNGIGNYKYGISPNGLQISEWDSEYIVWDTSFGVFEGKTKDGLLLIALQYAGDHMPMPARAATILTSGAKEGYPRLFSVPISMTMDRENFTF